MNKVGKISTVKRFKTSGGNSMRDSLTGAGLLRIPGAIMPLSPHKELDGSYRTGLDVNALYIRKMSEEQQITEKAYVASLMEKAKEFFGDLDLGPRSPFYTNMFKDYGKGGVCKTWQMIDGDNIFNLDHPLHLITYAWLRVHIFVAPSATALQTSKYSMCNYYVNDSDVETQNNYRIKSKIAEAITRLSDLNPSRLRQVARQCGFSVTIADGEEGVFNHLYDFINESSTAGKSTNLRLFNSILELNQEDLDIRDIIKEGFIYGVFKNFKGAIYRGDNRVAANEEELLLNLTGLNNQDDLLAVEQELKIKRSQIHS